MSADPNEEPARPRPERGADSVSRRRLASGVGWSVPVVLVAGRAPAFASSPLAGSCPDPGTMTYATAGTYTLTVPASCPSLTYTIIGGEGGGNYATTGSGAQIEGTILLSASGPQLLTLVVGSGGAGGVTTTSAYAGGVGYGNGGTSGYGSGHASLPIDYDTGGGGAGSAILLGAAADDAPIVVAGGGGGGTGGGTTAESVCTDAVWTNTYGKSGDATETGTDGEDSSTYRWKDTTTRLGYVLLEGSGAGSGSAGGADGLYAYARDNTARITQERIYRGASGQSHVAGGGNGGRGGHAWGAGASSPTDFYGPMGAGPGGGGGYAGGGGGNVGYQQDSCGRQSSAVAGGAGAGSSYTGGTLGATASGTFSPGPRRSSGTGTGLPGSITISWG